VKRIVLCICLVCGLATGWSITERGEHDMKSIIFAMEVPPIDRAIPALLETATFALG
jgi:hypothetical protein